MRERQAAPACTHGMYPRRSRMPDRRRPPPRSGCSPGPVRAARCGPTQGRARNAIIRDAAQSVRADRTTSPGHVFDRPPQPACAANARRTTTGASSRTSAAMALKQVKSPPDRAEGSDGHLRRRSCRSGSRREALRKAKLIADTDRDDVRRRHRRRADRRARHRSRSPRNIRKVSSTDAVPGRHRRPHRDARRRHVRQRRERPAGRARNSASGCSRSGCPRMDDRTRPDHAAMAGYAADPAGREVHRRRGADGPARRPVSAADLRMPVR